jgi:tetratricopeptide (TPR) repeat protein
MLLYLSVVAAVLAILTRVALSPRLIRPIGTEAALVVFPFRESGEEAATLGEGLADILAAALDGTVGIRVADPASAWRPLLSESGARPRVPELEEARAVAADLAASSFVLGTVTAAGGRLVTSARLYDRLGQLRATLRAAAPAESLAAIVNRLALDLVSEVWERDSLPTVPVIEGLATEDLDAMKAYLEAKSLGYRGRWMEAEQAIERAVRRDTTFALAFLEQFHIRSWLQFLHAQPYTGLQPIIERAMRYRDRLSPRNRLLVEAHHALEQADGRAAATRFGQVLEIDSLDVDASRGLAYTLLVHGWQLGRDHHDVLRAYQRVLEADSLDPAANATLARLAMWSGDDRILTESLERLRAGDTTAAYTAGTLASARALRAPAGGRRSVMRAIATQPLPVVTTALRDLRTVRPELAELLVAELLADSLPPLHQRVGLGARTQLWFAEGRVVANDSLVRSGRLDALRPIVNRYFVAASLAGVGDSAAAVRAVRELGAYAPRERLAQALSTRPDAGEAAWAVAAYHATFGDTAEARRWQERLAALPRGDAPWDWPASLAADVEARLAARGGDLAGAEAAARTAYDRWAVHSSDVLESDPEPAIRFHLAAILQAQRKPTEAIRLYRSLAPPHTWAGFYTARAAFELGVIAESRGNYREAALRYGAALALWERGEAEVADWRDRAAEGLRRALDRSG